MVSIRGAITVDSNTSDSILENTTILLEEIIKKNQLDIDDIISIFFSTTKDLTAIYPAVAARNVGITDASLLCVQEMDVENSMNKCIRVLLHVNKKTNQKEVNHIYLKEAVKLRPDIN